MERGRCLSVMIDLLPKTNRGLLDRLMFHLARVAHQVRHLGIQTDSDVEFHSWMMFTGSGEQDGTL